MIVVAAALVYLAVAGQLYDVGKLPFDVYHATREPSPSRAFTVAADVAGIVGAPFAAGIVLSAMSVMTKHPDRRPHQNQDPLGRGGRRP